MSDLTKQLAAPFPPEAISWRVGSTTQDKKKGMALAFIDARDVMERLDAVCRPENWQDRYEFHGPRTLCYLSVRIDGEWITKADGAGDSDVEAEKGAISDALKRAAVKWGIGRYLYDLESPWVEIEQVGRSYRIKQSEKGKLAAVARGGQAQSSGDEIRLSQRPGQSAGPTLAERADLVEHALRNAKANELPKAWSKASKVLAELSTENPERLQSLTDLYESLLDVPF